MGEFCKPLRGEQLKKALEIIKESRKEKGFKLPERTDTYTTEDGKTRIIKYSDGSVEYLCVLNYLFHDIKKPNHE